MPRFTSSDGASSAGPHGSSGLETALGLLTDKIGAIDSRLGSVATLAAVLATKTEILDKFNEAIS